MRTRANSGSVRVEVGRIDDNGTKSCLLRAGATVEDLMEQAEFYLDEDKEKVIAKTTGQEVFGDDELVDGEVYMIAPEIESA